MARIWYGRWRRDAYVTGRLVSRDFAKRYRRSALGVAWSLVSPLAMAAIVSAVFSNLLRGDPSTGCFPVYVLVGDVTWAFMSSATSGGLRAIVDAGPLMRKVECDAFLFPVQRVVSALVDWALAAVAAVAVALAMRVPLGPPMLALVPWAALMCAFCAGLALALSALDAYLRDVGHLWDVWLTAWSYLTPLFYPASMLPGWLQGALPWNPMWDFVSVARDCLLLGTWPAWVEWGRCLLWAAAALGVGIPVFKRLEGDFVLHI